MWSQQYNQRVKRSVTVREFSKKRVREFSKKRRETDFSLSGENDSLSRADCLRAELRCTIPPKLFCISEGIFILFDLFHYLLKNKPLLAFWAINVQLHSMCALIFRHLHNILAQFFTPMLSLISLGQVKHGHMTMPGLPPFT